MASLYHDDKPKLSPWIYEDINRHTAPNTYDLTSLAKHLYYTVNWNIVLISENVFTPFATS